MSFAVGEGVVGVVAERREGMIVNDYRSSPLAVESFAEEMSVTALGAAPLIYRDRVLGVIVVTHLAPGREFTVADRETLALFAGPETIAISNARLYQEARSAPDRLEALSRQLIEAQEIEHRRLAREFHDEIGQSLTAVKIGLQSA